MKRNAFTLVELLVVVAVIAILISILLPAMEEAAKHSRIALCASNERAIGTALTLYTSDHGQRMPYVGYGGNNAFVYYILYRSTQENPQNQPTGFQNLGLLGTRNGQYLSLQSRAWFCPLQTCDKGTMFSNGDRSFWSAVPNDLDGSQLKPEDASLGWISRRTGYLRRRAPAQTDMESIKTTEYGAGVILADIFSYPPEHVGKSHGNSVNALFMDGGVIKREFDLNKPVFNYWKNPATPGYTPQSRLQDIWELLNRGGY